MRFIVEIAPWPHNRMLGGISADAAAGPPATA
jgi:hypothetical protein